MNGFDVEPEDSGVANPPSRFDDRVGFGDDARQVWNLDGETSRFEIGGEDCTPSTTPVAGHSFKTSVPALVCDSCGAIYFNAPALGNFDLAVANRLARARVSEGGSHQVHAEGSWPAGGHLG